MLENKYYPLDKDFTNLMNKTPYAKLKENIVLPVEEKKHKLISFMDSALNNNIYKGELAYILKRFKLSRKDIVDAFLDYNLDVHSHNNEIYQSQAIRVVLHLHNLIKGSWHVERQQAVSRLIKQAAPSKAIDLGFGVPSSYIRELCTTFGFHLTLCDNAPSAFIFANELLNIWCPHWSEKIDFLCVDMEEVELCVGDYDLYISLHSMEHVLNPTDCLHNYVQLSLPQSHFLIEIPIGPMSPEHSIAWDNIEQAKFWINCSGLEIIADHQTHVNPLVDLFAEPHGFNYSGYLMLCKKKEYR